LRMKVHLELIKRDLGSLALRIIHLIYDALYPLLSSQCTLFAYVQFIFLPSSYSRNPFARVTRSERVHAAN